MILNPYLIYDSAQQKGNCPRCYQIGNEKNMDFLPFGEKEPEIFSPMALQKKAFSWYFPFHSKSMRKEANFSYSYGKKFEIQR